MFFHKMSLWLKLTGYVLYRMSFADGSNKMIKIAYVKREREELSNSYSSHNEDDDEDNAHLGEH